MMLTTATQTHDVTITLKCRKQYFAVLNLQGRHELNYGFDFMLRVAADSSLLHKIVNICVTTSDNNIAQEFQGVVVEESIRSAMSELRVVSRLQQLNNLRQSLLYTNQSIIDIASKLFYRVGYDRSRTQTLLLQHYPVLTQCLQTTHESANKFLMRLLAEVGVFLWTVFDANLGFELVILADNNQAFFSRKLLHYRETSGMTTDDAHIYKMTSSTQKTVKSVTVQTRSEYSPKYLLYSQASADNKTKRGKTYFGKAAENERDIAQRAKIYLQAEQALQTQFTIHSTDASLAPGQRLDINADEVDSSYSGCYLVLSVTHYQNGVINENPAYYNVAQLIPATQCYRAPLPERAKFPITMHGKLNSTPNDTNTNYPILDGEGKQILASDHVHMVNSQPLPRMQPHAGPGEQMLGTHLPLSEGAEVMATAMNGNSEDFVILNSFYNDQNFSPVTQKNYMENIVRSMAGNSLVFNDAEKQSHITLQTATESNQIVFNHTLHKITLHSQQGGMNIRAANTVNFNSGSDMFEQSNKQHQQIIGDEQQTQIAKNLQHQAGTNIHLSSLATLNQQADNNLQIGSGSDLLLNCEQQTHLNIEQSDLQCRIEQGHVTLTTPNELQLLGVGNSAIHIHNGNSGTQLSTDGTIHSYGDNVLLQADNNLTLNGKVNYAAKINAISAPAIPKPITPTAVKPAPLHDAATQTRYWVKVKYAGNQQTTLISEPFTITASNDIDNPQKFLGQLTAGQGFAILDKTTKATAITFKTSEVIQIGQRVLSYPQSQIKLVDNDFVAATSDDLPDVELAPGDKVATITLLHPPIIINYRDNPDATLTPEQINYFKSNGNNAMIFIHGYNVPAGNFPKAITDITLENYKTKISYGDTLRTLYLSPELLKKQYSCLSSITDNQQMYPELRSDETYDWLNGTHACNWFLHMEENLNLATGQFDHSNYQKYTRCLHISWPGDQGETNFRAAEEKADLLAPIFAELLLSLHDEGIAINIIAHSMGNRLLLGALQYLVAHEKRVHIVDHIFMWQAALPNTVLSDNPTEEDNTLDHRYSFPDATKAVKKITVLFNENDGTLNEWYQLANEKHEKYLDISKNFQCIKHHNHNRTCYINNDETPKALGSSKIPDNIYNELIKKPILVNMTKCVNLVDASRGHSYMRIPNQDIIKYGYKAAVVSMLCGIKTFGTYDSLLFPGNHIELPKLNGDKPA